LSSHGASAGHENAGIETRSVSPVPRTMK
jgi:hypothetical protein